MRTSLRLGVLVLVLTIPGIAAPYGYTSESNSKIDFGAAERDGTEVVRPAPPCRRWLTPSADGLPAWPRSRPPSTNVALAERRSAVRAADRPLSAT